MSVYVCMYVCMLLVCLYAHTYIYLYTYTSTYTYTHTYTYAYTYTYTYTQRMLFVYFASCTLYLHCVMHNETKRYLYSWVCASLFGWIWRSLLFAYVDHVQRGKTALDWAKERGHTDIVELVCILLSFIHSYSFIQCVCVDKRVLY